MFNRQTPVKTVPSRRTTYAGGNKLVVPTWLLIADGVFQDWESCPLAVDGITVGNEAPWWPKLKLGMSEWRFGMFCGKDRGPICKEKKTYRVQSLSLKSSFSQNCYKFQLQ